MIINTNMSNNLTVELKKDQKKSESLVENNKVKELTKKDESFNLNIDFKNEVDTFSKENVLSKNGSLINSQSNITQNNVKNLLN